LVTQHPHLMANYGRAEINIVRGEGVYLFDESGNRYLDLVPASPSVRSGTRIRASRARSRIRPRRSFIAATSITTSRPERWPIAWPNSPALTRSSSAIRARSKRSRDQARAQTCLAQGREGTHDDPSRQRFVPRTHVRRARRDRQPGLQRGLRTAPGGFAFTPFNDIDALSNAIDDRTAALSSSRCRAKAACFPLRPSSRSGARFCTQRGALLIFDEVQTGMAVWAAPGLATLRYSTRCVHAGEVAR